MKYDPKLVDDYIEHLAEAAKNSRCFATEDIYNEFGVLLIKKGTEITEQTSKALHNHQLTEELDNLVELENALDEHSLKNCFLDLFAHNPSLSLIYERNNFEQALDHLCTAQASHRVLLQKLTVLKEQFPDAFEETLFDAWFGSLISRNANLGPDSLLITFTAGLYSNLGLLHIPKARLKKQDSEAYQSHPILSSLIAKVTDKNDKKTALATAEHHERLYGDGFPHSKTIHTLSKSGLCLATAQTTYQLAKSLPDQQAMNLTIALPYFRTHNMLNYDPVFGSALKTIMAARLPPIWQDLEINAADYNNFLLHKTVRACEAYAILNLLIQIIMEPGINPDNEPIIEQLQRTIALLNSAGLSNLEVVEMLCEEEPLSLSEILEFDLIQTEFFYAASSLKSTLEKLYQTHTMPEKTKAICTEQMALLDDILLDQQAKNYFDWLKQQDIGQ